MTEKIFTAIPSMIYLHCDEPGCGEEMEPDGCILMSNPPQYPHRCVNGHMQTARERFPAIRWARGEELAT